MRVGEVNVLAASCKPSDPSVWRWVCTKGYPLASKWSLELSQDLAWNNPSPPPTNESQCARTVQQNFSMHIWWHTQPNLLETEESYYSLASLHCTAERLCIQKNCFLCVFFNRNVHNHNVYNKHMHLQFPSLIESRWKLASNIQSLQQPKCTLQFRMPWQASLLLLFTFRGIPIP